MDERLFKSRVQLSDLLSVTLYLLLVKKNPPAASMKWKETDELSLKLETKPKEWKRRNMH